MFLQLHSNALRLRWLTPLALSAAFGACAPPAATPPSAPTRTAGEPDIRVGITVGADQVTIGGDGLVVGYSHGEAVARGETRITTSGRGIQTNTGERAERITFVNQTPGRFLTVGRTAYRGAIEVYARGGSITVVNELSLEDYLIGVVAVELGSRTNGERAALDAQAVVARTYALKNMGKLRSQGFDLRAGVSDQAYGGESSETELARAAVQATEGLVVTYQGNLISPFYSSTCGGSTASPEESFRTVTAVPYLKPVSDAHGSGYYCDISPRFRWSVSWDGRALADILRRTVPRRMGIDAEALSDISGVSVRRTGASGRILEARIEVAGGEIPVYGPDIRAVFATREGAMLQSTFFRFQVERDDNGFGRVVAEGGGAGHGVGMCQWGAIGRARAGQSMEQIVITYFPGTRIERWY
jgi:stage II sporulation protein D